MNDKISVVIPCYNAEKYIKKCLESILQQTYENLEIIVVNDGSTDSSKKLIEPFLSDKRVRCVDQVNGGEFSARNTGIKLATGKYIGFVDSDDYIEPDMYKKLYSAISSTEADIAVCNFNLIYEDKDKEDKTCYANMSKGTVNVYDNVYSYWANNCAAIRPNNYAWTRLYNLDVLLKSGIMFEGYKHSADTLFNFKLLPNLKSVTFVNEGLYNYVQHSSSGIHTIAHKANLAELYSITFQALVDYYKENNFEEFLTILPLHAYTRLRSVFFYSRIAGKSDEQIVKNLISGWENRDIFRYLTGDI